MVDDGDRKQTKLTLVSVGQLTWVGSTHRDYGEANQDGTLVVVGEEGVGDGWVVLGVWDGHGEDGEMVMQCARRTMESHIAGATKGMGGCPGKDSPELSTLLYGAFREAQEQVVAVPLGVSSGTTATMVVIARETGEICSANVGDSTGFLFPLMRDGGRNGKRVVGTPHELTTLHRTDNPGERERILAHGASIDADYVVDREDDRMVLSVTRALGDTEMSRDGISSVPQISMLRSVKDLLAQEPDWMKLESFVVVVGSDGIWDADERSITSDRVADLISEVLDSGTEHKMAERMCDALILLSSGQDGPLDDASAVVAMFALSSHR